MSAVDVLLRIRFEEAFDSGQSTVGSGFQFFIERPPHLLSGCLVERDDRRLGLAADKQDQQIAVDQWGGHAWGKCHLVFLFERALPEHLAAARIEAEKVPEPSDRVELAVADDRRRHRADLLKKTRSP
jgi:hypothetical protein